METFTDIYFSTLTAAILPVREFALKGMSRDQKKRLSLNDALQKIPLPSYGTKVTEDEAKEALRRLVRILKNAQTNGWRRDPGQPLLDIPRLERLVAS